MATREMLGIAPRLFANALVIITLTVILFFVVNSFTAQNKFLKFNSYVNSLNSFISQSLASKQAGEIDFDSWHAMVQIFGSSFNKNDMYPNVCFAEDNCPYSFSSDSKSCLDVLANLYSKEITKVNYADECKDKYCLCYAKLAKQGREKWTAPPSDPKLFGGSKPPFNIVPTWWGRDPSIPPDCYTTDRAQGCDNYASNFDYDSEVAEKINYAVYPFSEYMGVNVLVRELKDSYRAEDARAIFAYYSGSSIQDAAVNNCFEFFGVNEAGVYPEDIFEEVKCQPIEGEDTEGRQLFLAGAPDSILMWLASPEKFSITSTRFFREFDSPEIGMEFIHGG